MKQRISNYLPRQLQLWQPLLLWLAAANAAHYWRNLAGWAITLSFFLLVPGYLCIVRLRHSFVSRWETLSFSLGLSLLVMIVCGLLLNATHTLGFMKPLSPLPLLAALDLAALLLVWTARSQTITLSWPKRSFSWDMAVVGGAITLLPLLAIGGAIRLNNGASNNLTMLLFALVPLLFVLLMWRKKYAPLYPYAIVMTGLAVLFSTSLRGWFITGHDIHHEFLVFQRASALGFWDVSTSKGDPYNACLSITVLPAVLEKLTGMPAVYVFKALYQVIFAFSVLPVYFVAQRLSGDKVKALAAAFVFITFPTFLSDLPFLNRQEMAFVFFGLLILTAFLEISRRAKTLLTLGFLTGLILSHYSSSYVMIGVLLLAWVAYRVITFRRVPVQRFIVPTLGVPILLIAFLCTFLWNAQVTATTGGLKKTISGTFQGLLNGGATKDSFTQYSLLGGAPKTPADKFKAAVAGVAPQAAYVDPYLTPLTGAGHFVQRFTDVKRFNFATHDLIAKLFQLLLIIGALVLLARQRKLTSQRDAYFCALTMAGVGILAIITLLPRISVDYSVIRLFQQILIITALPIALAAGYIGGGFKRFGRYTSPAIFALIFLTLSGFVPQALGGFRPQLSLNNAGAYYDFFYTHKSDVLASNWLAFNRRVTLPIYMDTNAASPPLHYPVQSDLLHGNEHTSNATGYFYENYPNVHLGVYRTFMSGDLTEYKNMAPTFQRDLIYSDGTSRVYDRRE